MGSGPKDAYERGQEAFERKRCEDLAEQADIDAAARLTNARLSAVGQPVMANSWDAFTVQMMLGHNLSRGQAEALKGINLKTERKIKRIVVHAAETYPDMDIGADWIRNIHVNENGWRDIGYHLVISRSGMPEAGRSMHQVGAHTLGFNNDSIGICLAGGKARSGKSASNFTFDELKMLHVILSMLTENHPDAEVCGHHDLAPGRGCPLFDVKSFWYGQ